MANVCGSHLRIQGPPAELTRLLTLAAAPTGACYPDTDSDCRGPAWRVMHNLFPVPAGVLARPWEEAGRAWQEEHWGLHGYVYGSLARRCGREAVFEISTPHQPPHAWVAKVAADFPKLAFEHIYASDCFNPLGRGVYRRGRRAAGWESSDTGKKPGAIDVFLQTQWRCNALPLLKRRLRRRPNDARLYLRRAQAYRGMEAGDFDEEGNELDEVGVGELRKQILPGLEQAIALDPHLAVAHLERASFLQEQGALADARAALDAAVRADPKCALAWRTQAEIRRKSDPKGALRDANRALKLDTHDPNAYLLRGLIRRDADRPTDALCDIRRAICLDPCCGSAYQVRADILARSCFGLLGARLRNAKAQRGPGRNLRVKADQLMAAAIADLGQAAFWDRTAREAGYPPLVWGVCLNALGRYDDAVKQCSFYCEGERVGVEELGAEVVGSAYLMRAKAYEALGKQRESDRDRKAATRLLARSDLADHADRLWKLADTPAAAGGRATTASGAFTA